jgi:hypothetical protein
MILKLVRTEKYEIEDSTEVAINEETTYINNIKSVTRIIPINDRKNRKDELLQIKYENDLEINIVIGEFTDDNCINYLYKNIFLMNDEGKTIERLV